MRAGRTISADWNYYPACNLFRVAGIASSGQARAHGAQIRPLAEPGWQFAQRVAS